MSEKPKKRLVSKRQYVALIGTRARLTIGMVFFGFLGIISLDLVLRPLPDPTVPIYSGWWWVNTILKLAYSAFGIAVVYSGVKELRKVERVKLVTKRTSHLLPPEETLVRASDLPPSHQQAELLRGVMTPNSETPSEELLRATTNRQGD